MLLSTSPYLGHIITTEIVVWGIVTGAILAFTVYFFQMKILGSLVRELCASCVGEENGKTLAELGKNNAFYRHFLGDNGILRRIISVVGGTLPLDSEGNADFDSARFYIDENKLEIAEKRYSKDVKIYMYIIGVVACVAVGVAMHYVLPWALSLLPNA